MFLRQRYKLLALGRVSPFVSKILKLNKNLLSVDMADEGEEPSTEYLPEETKQMALITKKQAEDIAKFVTTIDIEYDKGVDALYIILNAMQVGHTVKQALKICEEKFTPTVKKKSK